MRPQFLHLVNANVSRDEQECWQRCLQNADDIEQAPRQIEELLAYLERYPLGVYNRIAAQAIEDLLLGMPHAERAPLHVRFRALRDPYLPAR